MKKLIKAIFIIALVALAGVGVVTIGKSLGIVDKIKSEIDKIFLPTVQLIQAETP